MGWILFFVIASIVLTFVLFGVIFIMDRYDDDEEEDEEDDDEEEDYV